jgi:hypothetical protein
VKNSIAVRLRVVAMPSRVIPQPDLSRRQHLDGEPCLPAGAGDEGLHGGGGGLAAPHDELAEGVLAAVEGAGVVAGSVA